MPRNQWDLTHRDYELFSTHFYRQIVQSHLDARYLRQAAFAKVVASQAQQLLLVLL